MDIRDFFKKICVNEFPCVDTDGNQVVYTAANVNAISKANFDSGNKVFYLSENDGVAIESEPVYIYRCQFDLDEEQYNLLMEGGE